MIKFINKIYILLICFSLLFLCKTNYVYASYYSELLENWNIKTSLLLPDNKILTDTKISDLPLLLITSEFDQGKFPEISKYKYIIVICDENFESEWLKCDKNSVKIKDIEFNKIYLGNKVDLQGLLEIYSLKYNNTDLLIIPSEFFFIPLYRENLREYFNYFLKSTYVDHNLSFDEGNSDKLNSVSSLSSSILNIFFILFFVLIVLVFCANFFTKLVNNPKDILSIILNDFLKKIIDFLILLRPLLLIFLIIMTFSIFLLLPLFPLKEILTFENFQKLKELNDLNDIRELGLKNLFQILTLFYILIFTVFIILFIIPNLLKFLSVVKTHIFDKKLNLKFVKFIIPILLFILLVVSIFFNISSNITIIVFILMSLFYIVFLTVRSSVIISNLYTLREKISLLIVFMIPFIIITSYQPETNSGVYKYENLFETDDSLVFFPYRKSSSQNALYNELFIKKEFNVFVENYLVYSPKYKLIKNMNLKNFNDKSQSYILFGNIYSNFINEIEDNALLKSKFLTSNVTKFLYLDLKNLNFPPNLTFELDINCRQVLYPPSTVLLSSLDSKGEKYNLLYFPGCAKNTDIETFVVPFKVEDLENRLYEISGLDLSALNEIRIYDKDKKINSNFIQATESGDIYLKNLEASSEITVYSDNIKEVEFENHFNISKNINFLRQNGYIDNDFLIWSDTSNANIDNLK